MNHLPYLRNVLYRIWGSALSIVSDTASEEYFTGRMTTGGIRRAHIDFGLMCTDCSEYLIGRPVSLGVGASFYAARRISISWGSPPVG